MLAGVDEGTLLYFVAIQKAQHLTWLRHCWESFGSWRLLQRSIGRQLRLLQSGCEKEKLNVSSALEIMGRSPRSYLSASFWLFFCILAIIIYVPYFLIYILFSYLFYSKRFIINYTSKFYSSTCKYFSSVREIILKKWDNLLSFSQS